jgi:hypothetical protein
MLGSAAFQLATNEGFKRKKKVYNQLVTLQSYRFLQSDKKIVMQM